MKRIYADNAATTKMSEAAVKIFAETMENNYGNASSLHWFGRQAAVVLQNSREIIAKHINAEPREVYFTSSGSESDNQAVLTGAKYGAAQNKRHIISSRFEHHAVLHALDKLKNEGFEITLLEVYENGLVRP